MKITLLIIALILAAFFSGAEVAFVTISRIEAEIWRKKKLPGARWLHYLISRPDRFLITALVGGNIAVISFTSIATYYLQPVWSPWTILVFNSLLLLILGEIIPKTLFRDLARRVTRFLALPVVFCRGLFFPITEFLNLVTGLFMRLLGQDIHNVARVFSKQDLEVLLREGVKSGAIEPDEKKIIARIFRFTNLRVRDILVPRIKIVALLATATIQQTRELFGKSLYSRLPIIGKDLDEILGVVYAKDLLRQPASLSEIIRAAMFVPKSILCADLLQRMQQSKTTMAIAIDEFGGTAGLVTMEDIVEELFGAIADEFDERMVPLRRLPNGEILVSGRTEVYLVNEEMSWNLPTGNYETISGMILEYLRRFPQSGEKIQIEHFLITILRTDKLFIRFVKIKPMKRI